MAVQEDLFSRAWEIITDNLSPMKYRNSLSANYPHSEINFHQSVEILQQEGLIGIIEEWFIDRFKCDLREQVSPHFWKFFPKNVDDCPSSCLVDAVNYLHEVTSDYVPCIQRIDWIHSSCADIQKTVIPLSGSDSLSEFVITLYKAILLSSVPKQFEDVIKKFYAKAFKVFQHTNTDEDEDEVTICCGCSMETESCQCQQIMEDFHSVNRKLDEMGLLERICGGAVTSIVHYKIQTHIEDTCKGSFENSFLDSLEQWLDSKVLGWLNLIYSGNRSNIGPECISAFKGRLYHFVYETYARLLVEQLFNIIIEFPESDPAIADLRACLEKTNLRSFLVSSLKTALETRLLHPGVNTSDILTAYISAIRALRVLDPAGVILDLVCDPVRKYLRSRDDTVRCIVSSLTDDGSNELLEELVKGQPLILDESDQSDDEKDAQHWMPDPVDADPAYTSKSRRASDIISMLVNIYGSKELFVNEYRILLADRILTHFNYDIVKELRYLELLKLRFGDTQLHYCEVMLKDVGDSKRINANIVEEKAKLGEVDDIDLKAMILSAQFWPSFREEKITLPDHMQEALEKYTQKFSKLKGNRTLNWRSHLGLVNIDIEVKDRTLNFNVSPVHAAIIMQFQNQARWTVDDLSSVLQMPASALRRKITYWQSQGLLKEEETDTYLLVEDHKGLTQDIVPDEEEAESAMASAQAQREEELQVFWSFIVGMLTNLDNLPIERIHSMLKMFAPQGPSTVECSLQELKHFLDRKVKEQKLMYSGGVYRLPKPL